MRIITGKAKGRKLLSVPGDATRPITDRVKTALFSIIRLELEGSDWLDLFAGSGAVGLEALSEGAASCAFVEINKVAYDTLQQNAALTKLKELAEIKLTDAFSFLKNTQRSFDFIYIDPPQFKGLWDQALQMIAERPELLKEAGRVILKIHPNEFEESQLDTLKPTRSEKYGNSMLVFFEKTS